MRNNLFIKSALSTLTLLSLAGTISCSDKKFNSSAYGSEDLLYCNQPNADRFNCDPGISVLLTKQTGTVNTNKDVDILFVVDNSQSMENEQLGIGAKIDGFLKTISGLNWQIALTTTDTNKTTADAGNNTRNWGDGQFRPFDSVTGSQFVMKSSEVTASAAQTKLSNAIYVGAMGDKDERGIHATYRAIERASTAGSAQKAFFRNSARLAVVLISDEDECSTGPASGCASSTKSVPANLINLVQQKFGTSKVFSFNSIIYNDNCNSTGYNGNTYKSLSLMTGGLLGSVCSSNFTTPLKELGNKVTDLVKSVSLSCQPQDVTGDGIPELKVVLADGSSMTDGFAINGATVTFDEPLDSGSYELYFYCKN